MLTQDDHDAQAENSACDFSGDPALDEPPCSPALHELLEEHQQAWLAHDQDDADLLGRPDAGDLPAPWLPKHRLRWLTPDLVKPLTKIIVVQRSDALVGDGFYADYGVKVERQLAQVIEQPTTLYAIALPELPTPTLSRLWAYVQEDRERFQRELVNFLQASTPKTIRPTRRAKGSRHQAPHDRNGNGTQPEASQWRRVLVHPDQVQAQPIQWLWKPYLPRAMLAMCDGDPGLRKSLLLLQVATKLSLGHPFPDQPASPRSPPTSTGRRRRSS